MVYVLSHHLQGSAEISWHLFLQLDHNSPKTKTFHYHWLSQILTHYRCLLNYWVDRKSSELMSELITPQATNHFLARGANLGKLKSSLQYPELSLLDSASKQKSKCQRLPCGTPPAIHSGLNLLLKQDKLNGRKTRKCSLLTSLTTSLPKRSHTPRYAVHKRYSCVWIQDFWKDINPKNPSLDSPSPDCSPAEFAHCLKSTTHQLFMFLTPSSEASVI
jgi:hypothetical protein